MNNTNDDLDALALQHDERQGQRMVEALYKFLGRFVVYPTENAQVAHALWIIHTHLMHVWESTPRIAFLSPEPASGKTRAMEVTELLVPNPVSAVNVSPAYLFRKVGSEEGVTILFDEIDTVFGPKAKDNEEIRGLLNAGHRRGAVAGRCVVHGKTVMTEEIPAYAAVALAGLGWLPDTILTRSVVVRMRRRHAGEEVEPFRRRIHVTDGDSVRAMIEVWGSRFPSDVITWPELPAEIQDRDADLWEPLVAVADAIGGDWPERAREAAVALTVAAKERDPSLGVRLLADLKLVFADHEQLSTKTILAKLVDLEEAPWGDIKGKPLNERGIARRLKEYGIKSKNLKIGGSVAKGYTRSDLHDNWVRYLPPPPPDNSATTATPLPDRASSAVAQVAHLPPQRGEVKHPCAHCGRGGDVLECSLAGETMHLHPECVDQFGDAENEKAAGAKMCLFCGGDFRPPETCGCEEQQRLKGRGQCRRPDGLAATRRPTFIVTLRAEIGVAAIPALRAALKVLLRRFGLRAVSIRESGGGPCEVKGDGTGNRPVPSFC